MISLDFSQAVALYAMLSLGLILAAWLFVRKGKGKDLTVDPKVIWHCAICTYTYINTREEFLSACPRCGSYNRK